MIDANRGDYPRYGEVWIADLEPVVGAEIGRRRPVLIVSNDANNRYAATVTVLPITSAPARRDYPDEVVVLAGTAGLSQSSRIKAHMVRTLDKRRLLNFIGALTEQYHAEINRAVCVHLNMLF